MLALVFSGELMAVTEFLSYHPQALWYNIITAITSATGQLFIFYTIKQFGPVVFTIIITTRQMFSMIISSFLFSHPITLLSAVGAMAVFGAVFNRIRRKQIEKKART